jgi:hypothetical protein
MKKRFSVILIAIIISGLIYTGNACTGMVQAESSIPKPSIPEFTVTLVDRSYDAPATQSIDPYTGETVTQPSHRIDNRTIEVTIKNQPFASKLMYNIRVKGHFSKDWTEVFHPSDGFPIQSDSEYTVLSFSSKGGDDFYGPHSAVIYAPPSGQVDFQVEAMNGNVSREIFIPVPGTGWFFTGEKSGWSNTQVLTVEANSVGEAEKSKVNPNQQLGAQPAVNQLCINWTEISLCAILGTISAVLIIALVYKRKRFSKGNTLAYQP